MLHAPLFLRHVFNQAAEQRENNTADSAATDVANPALDCSSCNRADQLAHDAATDRTSDRVAQRASE